MAKSRRHEAGNVVSVKNPRRTVDRGFIEGMRRHGVSSEVIKAAELRNERLKEASSAK